MTDRDMPEPLRSELDEIPVSVICQYLSERLNANVGRRIVLTELRDGRYQGGYTAIPWSEATHLQP